MSVMTVAWCFLYCKPLDVVFKLMVPGSNNNVLVEFYGLNQRVPTGSLN